MPLFDNIFNPMHNCEVVVNKICALLNVPVTRGSIKKNLDAHPDFASLLSVIDVLNNVGFETLSIKIPIDQLKGLPTPFIAQISRGPKFFSLIKEINDPSVTCLNPATHKYETLDLKAFESQFTGIVLLAEPKENAGEKDYQQHVHQEKRQWLTRIITILIIPIFTLFVCGVAFFNNGTFSISAIIYTLLTLSGTIVAALLLWYEVDKHNPALKQICSAGKKINCEAILHSKASRIFGISWGVIGFTYFAGSLLCLLVTGIYYLPVLLIMAWLNVLALPYIIFSIYYQAKIARQWCVMCLAVQAILGFQFIVSLAGGYTLSFRIILLSLLIF